MTLLRALLAFALAAAAARADEAEAVALAEVALSAAEARLAVVEKQYVEAKDPSALLQLRQRFADGETQWLLGEYGNASALLFEVVDAEAFKAEEAYPDAVYYLADSLYRTGSWLEARRYYRELFARTVTRRYQESLLKLLELSDRIGDWTGIEELYAQLVQHAGAVTALKPEVVYLQAKWLARRPDLADQVRISRALDAFGSIPSGSEYGPQARYFEGVLLVQQGSLDAANAKFANALQLADSQKAPPKDDKPASKPPPGTVPRHVRMLKIRDQARLALGRVAVEQGKLPAAIDHYQSISKESDAYADALYELSACWLRLDEHERALRTVELLLLVVEDSVLAPDARLLEAQLSLKLKRYGRAIEQFDAVSVRYAPVRDKIESLTKVADPVTYYDDLLRRGEETLDATRLLPDVARKYVTGRDVAHARVIVEELASGQAGLREARALLKNLEAALEAGKLDLFPTLQEGNARAVELENAAVRVQGALSGAASSLVARVQPERARELDRVREQRAALDERVKALPESRLASDARKRKYGVRTAELERLAFRIGSEIDSLNAQLAAVEKWRADTAAKRRDTPDAEAEFKSRIAQDRRVVAALEDERREVMVRIAVANTSTASAAIGGEADERLRDEYRRAVAGESALAAAALKQAPAEARATGLRIAAALRRADAVRTRAEAVRRHVRARAIERLAALRDRVDREADALRAQGASAARVEGETRQLVGRIALGSFERVERQFRELVLKADLGLLDAAWSRKRERTDAIAALEDEKRGELRELQARFAEALQEVE